MKKKVARSHSRTGRRPRWLTVLFMLLPLMALLVLLEMTLRVTGLEDLATRNAAETFAEFNTGAYIWPRDRELGPWFQVSDEGEVSTNLVLIQRSMHALRFPLDKDEGEVRLFALGGSTTQGDYTGSMDGGFPRRVEEVLRRRAPHRAWRVLNAGVGGMDSNAFPGLVREIIELNPDGLIVYAGNNEIRGRLIQVCTGSVPGMVNWIRSLAIVRVGDALLQRLRGGMDYDTDRMLVNQDTCMRNAALDQQREQAEQGTWGPDGNVSGEETWLPAWPDRTDEIYLDTIRQFERNLEEVFDLALDREVPVWLSVPPVNYQVPPTFALFRPDLSDHQRHDLEAKLQKARRLVAVGKRDPARALLEAILEEDPTHAGVLYSRGMLALEDGDLQRARGWLRRAIDRDFLGGRLTSHMLGMLRRLCETRSGVTCVDLQAAFEADAEGSLPGPELFVDFCHPSYERGVGIIATSIAGAVLNWDATGP